MSSEPVTRGERDSAVEGDGPPAELADPYDIDDEYDAYGELSDYEPDGDEPDGDEPDGDGDPPTYRGSDGYGQPDGLWAPQVGGDAYLSGAWDADGREPVLLVWPQAEFEQVDQRWPELLEPIGADCWEAYRRHLQSLIAGWARRGEPLSMVAGTADGFAEWLAEMGADPVHVDLVAMADAYGAYLTEELGAVELPPEPADPCWCGSGVSYAQCCQRLARA